MSSIITALVAYNQFLLVQINKLLLFIAKNIPLDSKKPDFSSPKYNKYAVDSLPVIKTLDKLNYMLLLTDYSTLHGKELKPIKSRGKNPVSADTICPRCGAPHQYIYDNNGGRGQFLCKVCSFRFEKEKSFDTYLACPFCGNKLSFKRERKQFNVHFCPNNNCGFYKHSLESLSKDDFDEYKLHPERFKLRYYYREFTVDFFKTDLNSMPKGSVNFNFRNFSPHFLGLCLTYHVNLGLSTRATARALWEVHQVKISHVMVSKYAKTTAALVKPFVDNFDYKPTNYLSGDETYIKIKGTRHYIWFIMDALKKSILGYQVSSTRDTGSCILAMRMAFSKFKEFPGKALRFVADGYTAYNLAQQQFALNNMDFNLTQVIGLSNDDPVSTEYRWLKQIIERLNRTFKFSYQVTNGYGSSEGSNTHVSLFVTYYNFLRPHSYTYWEPLNKIPQLERISTMPGKWQKLIELSQQYILANQSA